MTQLPSELVKLAIDQAKHEDSDGYFGFLRGGEWLYSTLLERAPEFDEEAAKNRFNVLVLNGFVQRTDDVIVMNTARWQHSQDAATIQALREEVLEWKAKYIDARKSGYQEGLEEAGKGNA